MVLPLLIIGVLVVAFLPQIASAAKKLSESDQTDTEKAAEKRELEKQIKREDEGILKTTGRILFGDKPFDNKIEEKANQEFEEKAQSLKSKQAKDAGFESIREFEIATDPNRDLNKFNPPGIVAFGTKFSRRKAVIG